jgi:FkbM family methyltransferase
MKIVQLGSNRGNDHVTDMVKSNDVDFLLLVEPHPVAAGLLRECYKDVNVAIIEECAIVPQNTPFIDFFYADDPNPNYEVSSLNRGHIEKHGTPLDKILKIQVPAMTLEELFIKHTVSDLDYLFIDIEGSEESIMLGFDFGKYNIQNIVVEYVHMKNQNDINEHLFKFGYSQTSVRGFDVTYSRIGA